MRNYFYFRTATDVADDDGGNASGMFPVDKFRGAIPSNSSAGTAANVITLFFESALNEKGAGQNGEVIIQLYLMLQLENQKKFYKQYVKLLMVTHTQMV